MPNNIIFTIPLETEIYNLDAYGNLVSAEHHPCESQNIKPSEQAEYLSVHEMCYRTGLAKQTVYNYIHKKVFAEGIHYFRPTPRKILFKWPNVVKWIEERKEACSFHKTSESNNNPKPQKERPDIKSFINI